MNKTRLIFAIASVLVAAVTLSACSSNESMGGMNHESSTPESSTSDAAADFNDADVTFASNMIMHHQQAIEMADMFLEKDGVDTRVTTLAEKIKAAQEPEMDTMNGWLDSWGEATDPTEDHDMGEMSGSMSDEDMTALMEAPGPEADRLFLTQMIEHHTGAVEMADEEINSGQNPAATALAEKIVAEQTAEIKEMESLLAEL